MNNDLYKILARKKMQDALLEMNTNGKRRYGSDVAKRIKTTHSAGSKIMKELEEMGLLNRKKEGRKFILTLNLKGKEIAIKLKELREVLEKE